MIILPAIDIKDGNCVRLYKGDFSTAEQVADDPLRTARRFEDAGAKWIHMVDLDGAKDAAPVNADIFTGVARKTSLKVEVGGGIRSMDTVEYYLSKGIARVILGSAALKNPALVREAVKEYCGKIAVGIDAKDGYASAEGWLDDSRVHYVDLAKEMCAAGVQTIIFTDIAKDGTLEGPNFSQLQMLRENVPCNVIASGGISCLDDIRNLTAQGVYGAICGKSIYKGTLDLAQAIDAAGEQNVREG